jgi:xylulokinase
LFQSRIFAQTVTNLLDCPVEVVNTTGAIGAARASAVATGVYPSLEEAMAGLQTVATYRPGQFDTATKENYRRWVDYLERILA